MGLLNMLTSQGSNLSAHDGANPPVNPLATQQSKLIEQRKRDLEAIELKAPDLQGGGLLGL